MLRLLSGIALISFLSAPAYSQVELRDSVITWQHHRFELNEDNSIKSFSTDDNDIQEVTFTGKVIENDLIRLVLLPEYGGRVLSFVYKPTGHEYLYQSECGSAYGIGDGNFYYNWLMVYGGIFPTFPEPEHGKSWLLPWDYSVVKQTDDTVTVRMQLKDSTAYSGAPGQFNNGITNITCQVDISVYKESSLWGFDVKLINNEARDLRYEYWTCTTLAPGSVRGDTGTPLDSELIIPVDEYFAGWSPGAWIGNFNGFYDYENIDYLSKWQDMGIAYAHDLQDEYWGVINHENEEGIFRVSDNQETYGVKLWTWGRGNVDNNLFDWSNGGADNYIELWAGVSSKFFEDATLSANGTKSWKEAYYPTIGLSSIDNMNETAAVNLTWDEEKADLGMQLNTFNSESQYYVKIYVDDVVEYSIFDDQVSFSPLGHSMTFNLEEAELDGGLHIVRFELYDSEYNLELSTSEEIEVTPVLNISPSPKTSEIKVISSGNGRLLVQMPDYGNYRLNVYTVSGQNLSERYFVGSDSEIAIPGTGVYIFSIMSEKGRFVKKVYLK